MRAYFHFKDGIHLSFKTTPFSHLYFIKFTNLLIDKSVATSHLQNIPLLCQISKVTYRTIELFYHYYIFDSNCFQ